MGDNNSTQGDTPIPFAAPIPDKRSPEGGGKNNLIPVAIAAFVGALAGAVVGSQLG